MDTSETYIKMCEKAEEVQAAKPNILGHWRLDRDEIAIQPDGSFWYGLIWLPRQDQLQEISGLPWWAFDMLCLEMAKKGGSAEHIKTKEQVGIMAVMILAPNKIWNGEDWITEGLT